MQIFYDTLRSTFIHFIEPVSKQILSTVLKELGYLDFFGDNIYYKSMITGGSETNDDSANVKLTDNRVTCEILDDLNPRQREGILTPEHMSNYSTPFYRLGEKAPILRDDVNRIHLLSHLVPAKLELQNRITFTDAIEAANFMARLYSVYGNNLTSSIQTIAFDTPIPDNLKLVLFSLFKLLDRPIEDFYKYLYEKSDKTISFNADAIDTRRELVIRNGQVNIHVKIEFDQERAEADTIDSVSKSYSLQVKLTTIVTHTHALYLQYSETINNQLIPITLHPKEPVVNTKNIHEQHPVMLFQEYLAKREWMSRCNWNNTTAYVKGYLENVGVHPYTERLMIQEPWFDRWFIPGSSYLYMDKYYLPFFCVLFTIDDPGPTLLDLSSNINGITLTQSSIDKISIDQENCFNHNAEPKILITVFSNDTAIDRENLSISGTTVSVNTAIKENSYRIVLSKNMKERSPGVYLTVWNADINVYREHYTDGSDLGKFF